ncbi:MAG: phosphatidate cytidylyltransferase [Crocinitomicaceae bacterium TMED209]|jgi:phosphatidate cytidylyltransferase|nr:MAG: phosphatidate cytidylyltransferase [Crocinitomicaceae bacterium TMED209]|tara:strand:+ start:125 stop:1087 length:963 start_codon:yes stop_codon:yes gene_type:complete
MNKLIEAWSVNAEVQWVILIILCILVCSSLAWNVWNFLKPGKLVKELLVRTRSWWIMCACFVATTLAHPVVTVIGLAFLSYALLREMYPLLKLDQRERNVALLCYAVIPVQYALAYLGMTTLFLAFIPVFMFVAIPFMLVVRGETKGIVRSISLMPYSLVAWVYGMSHLAMLFNLPELPGFTAGPQGLLLYFIFLVGINDVLQFAWGKIIGQRAVLPNVSPNKTWEGLVGGVLSVTLIAVALRFLTPLEAWEAAFTGFCVAVAGFMGDAIASGIKRDLGIKNSGNAIPGHGGYLDRLDGFSTAAAPFFHLIYFFGVTAAG